MINFSVFHLFSTIEVTVQGPAPHLSDEIIPPHAVRDAVLRLAAPTTWDTEFEGPAGMKCKLFAYQRRALAWMAWRECTSDASQIIPEHSAQNTMAVKFIDLVCAQQPPPNDEFDNEDEEQAADGDEEDWEKEKKKSEGEPGLTSGTIAPEKERDLSGLPGTAPQQDPRVQRNRKRSDKAEALHTDLMHAVEAKKAKNASKAAASLPPREVVKVVSGHVKQSEAKSTFQAVTPKIDLANRASTSKAAPIELTSDSDCEIIDPGNAGAMYAGVSTDVYSSFAPVKAEFAVAGEVRCPLPVCLCACRLFGYET